MAQHRRIKHVSTVTVAEQAKVVAEVPTQPEVASTSPDKEKGDAVKTEVTATQGNAREAADKKPLRCETCKRPFGSKSALRQHKDVKHPAQKHSPQNNGRRTAKPNYHCNMCEKGSREKFGNQHALEKHQHKKHNVPMPVRPWPCGSCDRTFDTDSQLETHERCQHQIFRPKWHKFGDKCVECDPMFPVCLDFPIAEEDDIVVQGFFDLNCQHDDCDKSYGDSEERRQHEITVHNRCLTCTGYFSSEAELKEHQSKSKMVSEERRTHLLQLEMVIRQKEVLAAMLISSDVPKEEKTEDATEDKVAKTQQDAGEPAKNDPLHCRACNKTFRTKHKKKTSQRNERPVNRDYGMCCDICGQKRFLTQDALDQHQRQKHEKNIPTNRPKREDRRGLQRPSYKIPCIGGKFICGHRFKKVSHMMLHIETNNCISFFRSKKKIADLFRDHMGPDAHKFYNVEKECFECPECKGSEFKNLTTLIIHAEGDSCSMDPLKGPLHDAIREIPIKRMEKYLNPDLDDSNDWEDSDDSDDSNDSDTWYRDEDPWENFLEGHHFQYEWDIDELESYGYYGL
ncbi:hypothetical protein NW768_002888 [Fusarium equiseti]|uniref:C2H2-type domain-containing protein n=1 Tax=Fusarium equiseti TaxID=61235 RepID=A0ABQ8RKN3_FUSEQ|nr:hypothetical protein NW768_002888 [Fusarium equiseti]